MPGKSAARKITIFLPEELVEFADREASRTHTTRSRMIGLAQAEIRARREESLAAEGYRFYVQEAVDFAEVSARVTAGAIQDAGQGLNSRFGSFSRSLPRR